MSSLLPQVDLGVTFILLFFFYFSLFFSFLIDLAISSFLLFILFLSLLSFLFYMLSASSVCSYEVTTMVCHCVPCNKLLIKKKRLVVSIMTYVTVTDCYII